MKVEKILHYPIKGMRAQELDSATVTRHGFPWDRRYLLLKIRDDGSHDIMAIAHHPELARYFPETPIPAPPDPTQATLTIHHRPADGAPSALAIPLQPRVADLAEIPLTMHRSPTTAHKLPQRYNDWLTARLGRPVILVYVGAPLRRVLMSTSGASRRVPPPPPPPDPGTPGGWLAALASTLLAGPRLQDHRIAFADCAPYLVVSSTSLRAVDARLPPGQGADMAKFRPNIVVSGAAEAWEEDFWAELTIGGDGGVVVYCEQNCGRCKSINIDYETGAAVAPGEAGRVLRVLSRDRRVDPGTKWSPVFGRYAFLDAASEGARIAVGDEVVVRRRNEERSVFDWEGLCTK